VVAKELYNRWHEQTHMAQAIAARSFACAEQQWFAKRRHFDLMSTQASQAYIGATAHEKSRRAVEATAGVVLAYRGQLVPGYYSSCCGGVAASALDAIGINPINDVAPLRGRDEPDVCDDAPVFRWTALQPRAQLVKRIAAFGRQQSDANLAGLTQLRAIVATARSSRGRPQRFALIDQRGDSIELRAETLRQAINFDSDGLPPPSQSVRSSNLQAEIGGRSVKFAGTGFGHGAGMCQYGAENLAVHGMSFDTILRWYYPDVEMVESYRPQSETAIIKL
jgi:stage II sporulation protein D